MQLWQDFLTGCRAYAKAHRLMVRHGWWGYLLMPGLVHLLLLVAIVLTAWTVSGAVADTFFSTLIPESWVEGTGWLKTALRIFIMWVFRVLLIGFYLFTYKYIILILLAPMLAYLSEITEEKLTGRSQPFQLGRFLRDVWRGMLVAVRNLGIELTWMIGLFLLAYIPGIGLTVPVALILIQSYFYGFSMGDYYMERRRMSIGESVRFMRRHKGMAIANGMVFFGMMLVPVIGWMLAPVYAVIAATIAAHKLHEKTPSTHVS